MSFPQIRYHGNKTAGFRHTKRGLAELFRIQELQKLLGVPILKRTVEISEYTYVTVSISEKQTFVDIYSNPPELPEILPIQEEKELPEGFRCPSAFLIRSLHDGIQGFNTDGYLIAYNQNANQWEVAKYRNEQGEVVPEAGNLGWYHLDKKQKNGAYGQCDVLTWRGQSTPNFWKPFTTGNITKPARAYLQRKIYFQGRAFNTESLVVGACILKENDNLDYIYVHGVETIPGDYSVSGKTLAVYDTVHRATLNDVLASDGSPNWDSVGVKFASAFDLPFYGTARWYGVPSGSYVDENGFSYCTRNYNCALINPKSGNYIYTFNTVFIKFNLRDLTYEILSESIANQGTLDATYSLAGIVVPGGAYGTGHNASHSGMRYYESTPIEEYGGSFHGNLTGKSNEDPWVFYVYPGTQDLYYLAHEYFYAGNSFEETWDPTPGTGPINPRSAPFNTAADFNSSAEIVVYKNFKEYERIPLGSVDYAWSAGPHSLSHGIATPTWYTEGPIQFTDFKAETTLILHYHPEIKDSLERITTTMTVEDQKWSYITNWIQGEETTLLNAEIGPAIIDGYGGYSTIYGHAGHCWIKPEYIYIYAESSQFGPLNNNDSMYPLRWSSVRSDSDYMSDSHSWDLGYASQQWSRGNFNSYFRSRVGEDNQRVYAHTWGTNMSFILKNIADGADVNPPWLADCYAIHRPVKGGQKPFLWLKRNLYPTSTFTMVDDVNIWIQDSAELKVPLADADPVTVIPDPYWPNLWTAPWNDSLKHLPLWTHPTGSTNDLTEDPDKNELHWKDEYWYLESNFISGEQLNALTKETGNNFFNIGIL